MQGDVCLDCGAPLTGRFCAGCGQKRIEPEERRMAWFLRSLAESAFGVDGRLRRTLASFALRPGELGAAWLAGQRSRYLPPLGVFLLVNLLYFIAPRLTDLALPLSAQFLQYYGELARALVDARLVERGIPLEAYAPRFEVQVQSLAKLLVIAHPLLLAPVLALVLFRRRIPVVDHLAIALHVWAGLLAIALVLPYLIGAVYDWIGASPREHRCLGCSRCSAPACCMPR